MGIVLKNKPLVEEISSLDETVPDVISDEDIMLEMQEHDLIVMMPPIKEFKIRIRVKSIEKAFPRVVEPEESYGETISMVMIL